MADGSGRTALHHAGRCFQVKIHLLGQGQEKISREIKFSARRFPQCFDSNQTVWEDSPNLNLQPRLHTLCGVCKLTKAVSVIILRFNQCCCVTQQSSYHNPSLMKRNSTVMFDSGSFGLLDVRERRRFFPNSIQVDLWTTVRCFSLPDCCFVLSSAASGNIQMVQLLCELKSPVNLKDAVRTFIITSTLSFPDLIFLEEALLQSKDHRKSPFTPHPCHFPLWKVQSLFVDFVLTERFAL